MKMLMLTMAIPAIIIIIIVKNRKWQLRVCSYTVRHTQYDRLSHFDKTANSANVAMRFCSSNWNSSLIGRRSTMTSSPSRYTSTVRVDTGNYGRSEENDVTGNSVTSSRNPRLSVRGYLVSSPLSPCQSEVLLYLSTPDHGEATSPGLFNGHGVAASGEYINHNHQQQSKVISRTSRAVSVPASLHRDLDLDAEGERHGRHCCSDVKLTLQPTREWWLICIHHHHYHHHPVASPGVRGWGKVERVWGMEVPQRGLGAEPVGIWGKAPKSRKSQHTFCSWMHIAAFIPHVSSRL